MILASIPSPSDSVWHLGPLPLRAYALTIILGIVVAIWVGERRFVGRGGRAGTVSDVAVWAIPFGLVGARLYHVLTNPELYFGDDLAPFEWSELTEPHASALYVWKGGLGIWGAIALGALGAYIGCRVRGVRFTSYVDAVAPGIVLAQAIGRWGNYFNQELMGKPTDLPWAVEIDLDKRPEGYLEYQTFHPTFLYESLWCLGVAVVVILADRRWKLGRGRVFALYVALYTAGRTWIENLRIDDAHEFGPFRLNVWVSIAILVLAVAYFVIVGRLRPGREESVLRAGAGDDAGGADGAAGDRPEPTGAEGETAEAAAGAGGEDKDEKDKAAGTGKSTEADEPPDAGTAADSGKPTGTDTAAGAGKPTEADEPTDVDTAADTGEPTPPADPEPTDAAKAEEPSDR